MSSAVERVLRFPAAHRMLMALSCRGGRGRADKLGGARLGLRDEDPADSVVVLKGLGLVKAGRRVFGTPPLIREVRLTRAGRRVAERLWARARGGKLEGKVRFAGEQRVRSYVLSLLMNGRMEAADLVWSVGLQGPVAGAVVCDLASAGLVLFVDQPEGDDGDYAAGATGVEG